MVLENNTPNLYAALAALVNKVFIFTSPFVFFLQYFLSSVHIAGRQTKTRQANHGC